MPRSDDDLALVQVRAEEWAGFVFITMDQNAMPLLEYLDPLPRIFAPFQLEHMRYRWMTGVLLPCNWKTALDGFLEAYHVPGTHPQLFRLDKSNTHLATLKEIDNRIWSPTTTYERHAHYSSVGRKKCNASADSAKDPSMRETNGVTDERLAVALAVQYIHEDMRGLENERSWRAAEALKTADVPEGMSAGEHFIRLYRELSLAEGYDWPVITAQQWAAAGTAWNVFPNTILLPNQGSCSATGRDPTAWTRTAACSRSSAWTRSRWPTTTTARTSSPSSSRTTVTPALAWCSTRTWPTPRR